MGHIYVVPWLQCYCQEPHRFMMAEGATSDINLKCFFVLYLSLLDISDKAAYDVQLDLMFEPNVFLMYFSLLDLKSCYRFLDYFHDPHSRM